MKDTAIFVASLGGFVLILFLFAEGMGHQARTIVLLDLQAPPEVQEICYKGLLHDRVGVRSYFRKRGDFYGSVYCKEGE